MSPRPSLALPFLLALAACSGSAPADTEEAAANPKEGAGGASGFGIGTGLIVAEQLIRELDTHDPVMKVDVRLTPPNYTVVYVRYSTVDGSAKAGEDYEKVEGTLRFNPGEPGRWQMGAEPRLPKMPEAPTLMDFFRCRFLLDRRGGSHLLQSAPH